MRIGFSKISILTIAMLGYGCCKVDLREEYMAEARQFVKEYQSGDIARAKKACVRDWALGVLNSEVKEYENAYRTSMVFASERLSRICKVQGDRDGFAFWTKFRDENVSKIDMTLGDLTNAVTRLDREMGVSYDASNN